MTALPIINNQLAEKPDLREDGSLDVHSIFSTLQGEGPLAGHPAVFVRLAGCNLQCSNCDTDYTSTRKFLTVDELYREIRVTKGSLSPCKTLVVLTGGEPFRQNIFPLIRQLFGDGYDIQIETNGTLAHPELHHIKNWLLPNYRGVSIVCSPKTGSVHHNLLPYVSCWKYVLDVDHYDPKDGLPTAVLGQTCKVFRPDPEANQKEIFLQPEDTKDPTRNNLNLRTCIELCMRFGYRLSLQTHKDLNLP